MAIYNLEGTVHEIGDLKEGTTNEREWKLRGVVLETTREWNEKTYSDFIDLTAFGAAVDGLADVNVGDKAEASFTVSSRKKTSAAGNEYWGTTAKLIGLKVLDGTEAFAAPQADGNQPTQPSTFAPPPPDKDDGMGLPF